MQNLGICIIGCGSMAREHARTLDELDTDVYFASRDIEKSKKYAQEFDAKGYFGDYESAVKDDNISAVIICTPHDQHLACVKLAAKHKKHILLEKPIARSLEEADEIIAITKKAEITLMIAENFHFLPSVIKAKELIQKGMIGDLRFIQLNNFSYYKVKGWRTDKEKNGGGIFIDGGVHQINVLRYLAGDVKTVYAKKPINTHNMDGEDGMFLMTTTNKGVIAEINSSWATRFIPRFQFSMVAGTDGTIFLGNSGKFLLLWGNKKRFYAPGLLDNNSLSPMIKEFILSIKQKREPSISGEEGRKDLQLVLAAYESADKGKIIEIK